MRIPRVDWKKRALNAEAREATAKKHKYAFRDRWRSRALKAERQLVRLGPAGRIRVEPDLMMEARAAMRKIKECDEKPGSDGLCDCARYIAQRFITMARLGGAS